VAINFGVSRPSIKLSGGSPQSRLERSPAQTPRAPRSAQTIRGSRRICAGRASNRSRFDHRRLSQSASGKIRDCVHRRSLERAMARRKNRASWRKIIFRKERSKHTREFVGKQSEPMDEKDTRQAAVFLRSRRGILGSVGLDEALGHANRYIRQSTPRQVPENTESTQRQCALRDRVVALSWPLERIHVVELRSRQVWLTVRRPGWFSETGQRNRARQGEPGDGAGGLTSGAKLGRLASANRLMLAGGRTHSRRRRSLRSVRTSMTGSCSD
jgi:hypothetical protein